jgi:hypothetical protein
MDKQIGDGGLGTDTLEAVHAVAGVGADATEDTDSSWRRRRQQRRGEEAGGAGDGLLLANNQA